VIDPVMVATSGARLLPPSGISALMKHLLPLATLVTPNLDEAEILLGNKRLRTLQAAREAASQLQARFGAAFLVKGGHLRGSPEAVDFFCDGKTVLTLRAPYVRGVSTHGTGCTYSAAIVAYCARGSALSRSVRLAKHYITRAISGTVRVRRHTALGWFR
jgi:hydroxymethylpyrimidine/phosphomethylpyrimidine kinase